MTHFNYLLISVITCSNRCTLRYLKYIIHALGGSNADMCTSNMFWGCKRDGSVDHPINPIQSARLRSTRGFTMKYGKVEVEAKIPTGDWIWPGIFLN